MSHSSPTSRRSSSAERLRYNMAAMRLSLRWFGVRKSLSAEQKAEAVGATGDVLNVGKKLLDAKHPAFRAVSAIRGRIQSAWKTLSLPYPELGIRLIRLEDIERLDNELTSLRQELAESVELLDQQYADLQTAAQQRLGHLYDPADYPTSLQGLFDVEWEFPSLEPPDSLRQLKPQLYERECRRVASRFEEALQLAEQGFVDEFSQLVARLTERLCGTPDEKPKIFRDSLVTNLSDFFKRFRRLNMRSNEQFDSLVSEVEDLMNGIQPQSLRENRVMRQAIAAQLNSLQPALGCLMLDRLNQSLTHQVGRLPQLASV